MAVAAKSAAKAITSVLLTLKMRSGLSVNGIIILMKSSRIGNWKKRSSYSLDMPRFAKRGMSNLQRKLWLLRQSAWAYREKHSVLHFLLPQAQHYLSLFP